MAEQFSFSINTLSYDDILEELKTYYKDVHNIEYVANGNFDIYLRGLAYIGLQNSMYMCNLVNNLYLPSANTTESTFYLANQLGYTPRRRISSKSKVTAIYTPDTFSGQTFTITKFIFIGKNNSLNYIVNNITFTKQANGTYQSIFTISEKELKSIEYSGDNSINQEVQIDDTGISDDAFDVKSYVGLNNYVWDKIIDYQQIPDQNSRIYYIDVNKNNEVKLIFGNGYVGQKPQNSEKIVVNYYITEGEDGNGENEFEATNIISSGNSEFANISNYNFTFSSSYGGSGFESIEEIKTIAPKYFSAFGNNIIRRDYDALLEIAETYLAFSNLAIVNYSSGNLLGQTYLVLVPEDYRLKGQTNIDDFYPNGTLPISEITNLVSDVITYQNIRNYYNGWIYIDLISPSYMYMNITPKIEIDSSKNFNIVSKDVYQSLLPYVNDVDETSTLYGFNKKYRESYLYKLIMQNSFVLSAEIETNYRLMVNKDNIIDKMLLKVPENFLITNNTQFNNLKNNTSYSHSELLLEDKTVYCPNLESSSPSIGNDFERIIVNSDYISETNASKIFELVFDEDDNIVNTDILTTHINDKIITVQIFKNDQLATEKEYFVNGYIPLYYSTDNLQDANSDYIYNYSSTNLTYFIYFRIDGISYLVGEIVKITEPTIFYYLKPVDNKYGIQLLFQILNLSQYVTENFFNYVFTKNVSVLDAKIKTTNKIVGNLIFGNSDLVKQKDMNLKLVSRKKIFDISLFSTIDINEYDADAFSYDQDETNNFIYVKDVDSNTVLTLSYTDSEIKIVTTSNYSTSMPEYKNNKFKLISSGNVYSVYCYEKYDDIILATIDMNKGVFYFNENLSYYEDHLTITSETIQLNTLLDDIMISSNIYQMHLTSKDDYATISNLNSDFNTDDTVFLLPNLNQVQEK